MKFRRGAALLTAVALLQTAAPLLAHHSFAAEFDSNKPINVKGIVRKLAWVNPHAYIYVDLKDGTSGKVVTWAFEILSPNALARDGWNRVVDTVGFNEKTWMNGQGIPHTDALHVTERFTRPDLGHLEIEITLEDSGALLTPHTFKRVHTLMQGAELLEYVCNEFNIDKDRLVGNKSSTLR